MVGAITHRSDETTEWRMKRLGTLLSLMVVSKRHSSDTYAQLVRTEPMTLSAEVLWNLLPNGSFANEKVVLGGALEPAYQVGGDAFDYAIAGDRLHLTILDAMGHDAVRRADRPTIATGRLPQQPPPGRRPARAPARRSTRPIAEQSGPDPLRHRILADLNMRTGELTWVNRGHHPPLVIRDGRLARHAGVQCPPPHGPRPRPARDRCAISSIRGDRLLLYTDGITEAADREGQVFGLERFVDFIVRRERRRPARAGDPAPAHPQRPASTTTAGSRTTPPS